MGMQRWLAIFASVIGFAAHAQPVPITMPGVRYVVPAPVVETVRPPAPTSAPPPLQIPKPTPVTTCDAGGCWDSGGRHLERIGPQLVGPRGACSVQADAAQCP
jgi:hypothetical protein